MFNKFIQLFSALIIVSAIIIENTESSALRGEHSKKKRIADMNPDLEEMIRNSNTAWVVLFYNSFHPLSLSFKQNWISLSNSMAGWKDVVVSAMVDCTSPLASYLCEENGVNDRSSVQYFSPGNDSYGKGNQLTKIDTEEHIKQGIIENLIKDQQRGIGSTWPNILPFSGTKVKNAWKVVPNFHYYVFIFEKTTSFLGSEMILDLHELEYLQLRRVTEDNKLLCSKYNVTSLPALMILGRKEDQIQRNSSFPTINDFAKTIQEYMRSKGHDYIVDPSYLL